MTCDLVLVGGGPAGATLARLLGRRYKVLLLERRTFAGPGNGGLRKCCGGLLDPDAQQMLATFGLGVPREVMASPQMFAVRTLDFDNSIERYYQRHYLNVGREEFDRWLLSLLPETVDLRLGAEYRGHETLDYGVEVHWYEGGREYRAEARMIVGADGAGSGVRRRSFPAGRSPRRYIAVQEWFENRDHVNYYGAVFDREVTDFYSWIIPKDDCLIVGSALPPRQSSLERFALLKRKLCSRGFSLGEPLGRNGAVLLRPCSAREIETGRDRVALIGEAAGFISPSSAEGISYAFKSALALARALEGGLVGWEPDCDTHTAALKRNICLKTLKTPFMYNSRLRSAVMRAGLRSIRVEEIQKRDS